MGGAQLSTHRCRPGRISSRAPAPASEEPGCVAGQSTRGAGQGRCAAVELRRLGSRHSRCKVFDGQELVMRARRKSGHPKQGGDSPVPPMAMAVGGNQQSPRALCHQHLLQPSQRTRRLHCSCWVSAASGPRPKQEHARAVMVPPLVIPITVEFDHQNIIFWLVRGKITTGLPSVPANEENLRPCSYDDACCFFLGWRGGYKQDAANWRQTRGLRRPSKKKSSTVPWPDPDRKRVNFAPNAELGEGMMQSQR